MALLTVLRPGSDTPEKVRVTRRKSVSIGNHSTVDIAIEEDEIPPLLARIAWNGSEFEATAAAGDDILVNGQPTQQQVMADGDRLEAGEVVITMIRGKGGKKGKTKDQKPAKGDGPLIPPADADAEQDEPVTLDDFSSLPPDHDIFDEDDDDLAAPQEPARRAVPTPERLDDKTGTITATGGSGPDDAVDVGSDDEIPADTGTDDESLADNLRKKREEVSARHELRSKIRSRAARPGERDPIRSPLLQMLAGAIVLLLFGSIVLGLVLRQQSVQAEFDAAVAARDSGNYAESIKKFEAFLADHPTGDLSSQAKRLLALSQVDRLVRAAAPEWDVALEGLRTFIGRARDDKDFSSLYKEIAERAGAIALGSAADAGGRRNPALLDVSVDAEETLVAYSPGAVPPEKLLAEIEQTRRKSRRQLQTYDVLDRSLAEMTAAAGQPLDVLRTYRGMVAAEPTLARNREARDLREAALEALRTGVQVADDVTFEPAEPTDFSAWSPVSTATVLQRPPGREQQSGGLVAGVFVGQSLFGVDTGSGDPLWRQPMGEAFRPVAVDAPQAGWVGSDPGAPGLLYVNRDGAEVARIPLPARPLRPRADGTNLFVPLEDARLARVSLTQGQVTALVAMPQPILPEPAAVEDRLVAFGHREMVYLLDAGTLQPVAQYELGHAAGSVLAAPLAAARLVVVAVNDPRGGRVALLEVNEAGDAVSEAGQARVPGLVVDPPQLRGRDLFVPSSGGRATVLAINDEGGGAIALGPTYVSGSQSDAPTYLRPGSDRQFWMVGERMRRLRTTADSIRPVGRTLELGLPTEPPVRIGDELLVASKPRADLATRVSLHRGDDLGRAWLLYLGDALQAVSADAAAPVGVTRDGFSVRLRGGLVIEASDRLDGPVRHAIALPSGELAAVGAADRDAVESQPEAAPDPSNDPSGEASEQAAASAAARRQTFPVAMQPGAAGGPPGTLSIISRAGRISRRTPLPAIPTVAPVVWQGGIVAAPAGRLKWVPLDRGGAAPPDFWLAQGGAAPPDWVAVERFGDDRLATLDAGGTVRLLAWQDQPRQIVESAVAADPTLVQLAVAGDRVAVTDGRGVFPLDPSSLERGEPIATGLVRIDRLLGAGDTLLVGGVDASDASLVTLVRADGSTSQIAAGPLVGAIAVEGRLALATASELLLVTPSEGEPSVERLPTPNPIAGRPLPFGDTLAVPLQDGTLLRQAGE